MTPSPRTSSFAVKVLVEERSHVVPTNTEEEDPKSGTSLQSVVEVEERTRRSYLSTCLPTRLPTSPPTIPRRAEVPSGDITVFFET